MPIETKNRQCTRVFCDYFETHEEKAWDSKDIFHENFMPDVIVEGDENLLQVATVSKGNYC